jgi:hypothetical protein
MTDTATWLARRPRIPAGGLADLVTSAARAPSLHNTQPWRFRLDEDCVELRADPGRHLRHTDPDGREMLISCGAALYGLRLGMRQLGWQPVTEMLPDPAQPNLLARVRPGRPERPSREERDLTAAVPHRHTHRGPFAPGGVPGRLLADLVRDAAAEGATLVLVNSPGTVHGLARLTSWGAPARRAAPGKQAEASAWSRPPGSTERDGIPAGARPGPGREVPARAPRPAAGQPAHERLPGRDFGQPGDLPRGGALPFATAVLVTRGDTAADWLRAGQALYRLLLRSAGRWVFAALHTEPLESEGLRTAIRDYLGLDGMPQMLLQLGRANVAAPTPRRPAAEIIDDHRGA